MNKAGAVIGKAPAAVRAAMRQRGFHAVQKTGGCAGARLQEVTADPAHQADTWDRKSIQSAVTFSGDRLAAHVARPPAAS